MTPFYLSCTTTGLKPRFQASLQNSSGLFPIKYPLGIMKCFISQESAVTRNGIISQAMQHFDHLPFQFRAQHNFPHPVSGNSSPLKAHRALITLSFGEHVFPIPQHKRVAQAGTMLTTRKSKSTAQNSSLPPACQPEG